MLEEFFSILLSTLLTIEESYLSLYMYRIATLNYILPIISVLNIFLQSFLNSIPHGLTLTRPSTNLLFDKLLEIPFLFSKSLF